MGKIWILIMFLLSSAVLCLAAEKKIEAPAQCKVCGMDRTVFAQSRMVVTYTDGSSSGTCSLNCVVADMQQAKHKKVKSFQIADYRTKKLVDAKTATWVMGGKKQGVMTQVAKWAFADTKGAHAFIKSNGGELATFNEVLKATENELTDSRQPRKRDGHDEHSGH